MNARHIATIALLGLAACGHAKDASHPATPSPSPSARTLASPRPAHVAAAQLPVPVTPSSAGVPQTTQTTPTPPPAGQPAPPAQSNSSPSPVPSPTPTPVRLPPDAPPQIVSVALNETTVHSGDTVSGTVVTSSNVASVEVRVATYGASLAKVGVGRFALSYTLGTLPFFVHGTYEMRIIARNARGDSAQTSLPITVR